MALFLVAARDPAFAATAEQAARAQFALHGLGEPSAIDLPGWRLLHAAPIEGGPETLLIDGDDFVAVAGTPVFDGLMGRAALSAMLCADMGANPDWRRAAGHFIAIVRRAGRTFLFGDCFGIFQLYHDAEERVFSTSLLAALAALPRVSFDTQGVYEWAFGVVTVGNDTIFAELKMLGPERLVELTAQGTASHPLSKPLTPVSGERLPDAERIARNRAQLMRVVEAQVAGFGDRINCPLSGGMDSRLMLAALRATGCKPSVYVYGPPSASDVQVARAIGKAEGFHVEWIDKQAERIAPDAFAEQVARNFHELDGLPNFGNIFDNGVNARARDQRHAGGALAVSGGGGEVYRDFFMLPNRPASAMTLTRCFNSRFLASDATDLFEPERYVARIADKVAAGLGSDDRHEKLHRLSVEQAFPRVRLRALFRWEMNIESRHGPYALTFLDPMLTDEAMKLPIALKQSGRFEGMMIQAIDPALARHMSSYGHHFAGPPGLRYRLDEGTTRHRPVWLRERAYRIKRRLGPMMDEHGGLLSADYMGRVVDMELPIMRRFFHVDRITDAGLWRRIACLEHLAVKLGSRLTI
jgi:asparagine synthase (glutamine-hydrolysing)